MTILMCAQKLTDASLIYRTEPETKTSKMKKLKTNGYAQKKRCRARKKIEETMESAHQGRPSTVDKGLFILFA